MERLTPGTYTVSAPCPDCGTVEDVLVRIGVRRTADLDDGGLAALRVTLKGKASDHECGGRFRQVTVEDALEEAAREGEGTP